jgi:hypothetical protein
MSLSDWRIANGWREVFARVFENFDVQYNVSPDWLKNPATNRRLKLDILYPQLNIAVRFEGLRGKQRRRLSLEEEDQQQVRFDARVTECFKHGIRLIVVDLINGKPRQVLNQIDRALSESVSVAIDEELRQNIKNARRTTGEFFLKITGTDTLALYADLWLDRQYRLAEPDTAITPTTTSIEFTTGMAVEHTNFGPGIIIKTSPSNGDTFITVDFVTAGQKTFAASLVVGKLQPRQSD